MAAGRPARRMRAAPARGIVASPNSSAIGASPGCVSASSPATIPIAVIFRRVGARATSIHSTASVTMRRTQEPLLLRERCGEQRRGPDQVQPRRGPSRTRAPDHAAQPRDGDGRGAVDRDRQDHQRRRGEPRDAAPAREQQRIGGRVEAADEQADIGIDEAQALAGLEMARQRQIAGGIPLRPAADHEQGRRDAEHQRGRGTGDEDAPARHRPVQRQCERRGGEPPRQHQRCGVRPSPARHQPRHRPQRIGRKEDQQARQSTSDRQGGLQGSASCHDSRARRLGSAG